MEPASAAAAAFSFFPTTATGWGSLLSSAMSLGGLFGGGERSARDQMSDQMYFSLLGTRLLPQNQVIGLRAAGLNPMLAATKGPAVADMPSSGVTDDRSIGIQKASAMAVIANQAAQARLYEAQAENVKAQTATEMERPANVAQSTRTSQEQAKSFLSASMLNRQLEANEGHKAKGIIAESWLKDLTYQIQEKYGPKMAEEAFRQATSTSSIMSSTAKSAQATEAALDKLPAEWLAIIRIIRDTLGVGSVNFHR